MSNENWSPALWHGVRTKKPAALQPDQSFSNAGMCAPGALNVSPGAP